MCDKETMVDLGEGLGSLVDQLEDVLDVPDVALVLVCSRGNGGESSSLKRPLDCP